MSDFPPPPILPVPAASPEVAPDAIRAQIVVYCNQKLISRYSIENGEYIIGRDSSCHIVVDADQVSRHHARLTLSGFELILEDLESSNGVFIDGVQVQIPTRVRADQEVQIGGARLRIGLEESSTRQFAEALWDKDLGLGPVREMLLAAKYRVTASIAQGGMGVIMQARDLRIRRTVAMKVMKTGTQFSRENVLRFVDEAQLTGQLEHPNIVPVYELGLDEQGEPFYAMKYVQGATLAEVLRGVRNGDAAIIEKYPLATLITIFQKICDAVAFAHSKGVIHRDLKPENIMVGNYGEVLVMDWGLAKNMTGARREQEGAQSVEESGKLEPATDGRGFETMHGLIVGTPPYISPEQARGELDKIDSRSDVFVLGEILYAILTLRAPVVGENVSEMVEKILGSQILPPSSYNKPVRKLRRLLQAEEPVLLMHCPGRRVPEGLSAVVMKAMHLEAAARYQRVDEMQSDITAWQGGFPTKAERASVLKHGLLFIGRHKGEVSLIALAFVIINVMVVGFIYQLSQEKNRALENEQHAVENAARALESERLAADRLVELHGTAPTYFAEAQNLTDDQKFIDALDKIEYALEQVPNDPDYNYLRANILQSLLRWEEAAAAYETVLERNPGHQKARLNLALTRRLLADATREGKLTPAMLKEFHAALLGQNRVGEALGVLKGIGHDKELFSNHWKAYFRSAGLKERSVSNDDETLEVDLSKLPQPDIRKLGDAPIISLNLDDTGLSDITGLKGRELQRLSLNRTRVHDLMPLAGMPLRALSAEGTRIIDLSPLSGAPLQSLRIADTRVNDLSVLRGMKIEQLLMSGCRLLKDLTPLHGLPLQSLDVSRTGISDLSALVGTPLRELRLEGCVDLTDLYPLLEMKTLEAVVIPSQCKEIDFLRGHPSIKRLSYKRITQPVYEFWEEFDARQAQAAK
ncbi:MAG: pknB 22 [Chthoniobacteraceae bacterium]|nr:pknB 22 [Chthoniobacteraceae bacterium]